MRSVRIIRTRLFRWIQSYRSREPNTNDAVSGTSSSKQPRSFSGSTPSLNISVQIRSPLRSIRAASTASGTAPMPSCKVDPSSTRAAIRAPIWVAISPGSSGLCVASGSSTSTR